MLSLIVINETTTSLVKYVVLLLVFLIYQEIKNPLYNILTEIRTGTSGVFPPLIFNLCAVV